MRYSNILVWESVYKICPHFKVMRDKGITVNLHSALKDCAVQSFLSIHKKLNVNYELSIASMVIGDTLIEMGEME